MNQEKEKWLEPKLLDGRNKIIGEFLDLTFDEALAQVDQKFENETEFSNRLIILAARSWLIRKKVYALLHEPFVFSVGDLEGLDISPTITDEEDDSLAASLFDDDDDDDVFAEEPKEIVKKVSKKATKKKTEQTDDTNKPQTDDTNKPQIVKISIIKNMTLNGVKLVKDMVLEVSSADAGKLVAENKARIVD